MVDDLIENTYSCIRCQDETCGGECMDPKENMLVAEDSFGSDFGYMGFDTSTERS